MTIVGSFFVVTTTRRDIKDVYLNLNYIKIPKLNIDVKKGCKMLRTDNEKSKQK